jgi:nucleoid-associated protein YgaU
MGLFDFVKEAGRKLGLVEPEAPEVEAKSPDQIKEEADKAMAAALVEQVKKNALSVENLGITYRDGMAIVYGTTPSQAEREKVVLVVGNVRGVGQVDDRIEVVTPEPAAQFHTVVSGDTLSKIAKEYYGSARKYPVIFEANKPMLSDPNKIYPGQVLRIPPIKD